eukprot:PITA_35794
MLKEKHLPHEYWVEVVTCAVYILNRCPTKVVMNKIPEEAWSDLKQIVTHMRVFGCVAYAHLIVSHEEEQEGTTANNPSLVAPPPPQQVQQTTPQAEIRTALRSQGNASLSTPQGSEIPSSSEGTPSTPRRPRFRNLNEIYEQGEVSTNTGLNSLFALYCLVDDSVHFEDVVNEDKWIEAMNEEIGAIEKSKTWELVDLPEGKDAIGVKWVYKSKSNVEGKIDMHKARLVVKGYKQQQGKDYDETFAPIARMETVRTMLSIAAPHKWKIYQMDVKSAFLNGVLKEEVYVEQPPGYEVDGQEHKVYKLKKALYGLKQAPRAWYNRIDAYLIENGFNKCDGEPTLYIKENDGKIIIIVLYVDDLIFTGNDASLIADFKAVMKNELEMTDLGFLRYFLGIEVDQSENGGFISQDKYVEAGLKRFNMQNSKAAVTPTVMGLKLTKEDSSKDFDPKLYKSIVGSVMHLTATRSDIMHAVSLISAFMERPKETHWQAAKRILRKSTSGYVFHMGSGAISWVSKKQPVVSLSTTEAVYVAATAVACQAVWLRRVPKDLCHEQENGTTIYCDHSSAITLSKNFVFHKRTKHIDTKFHFIRELVNNGEIILQHCRTEDQLADIFTKPLAKKSFDHFRKCMGMQHLKLRGSVGI